MTATALRGLVLVVALLVVAAPAHAALETLDNGTIRLGVDLEQGGKLTWLSRSHGLDAGNLLFEAEQSYSAPPSWYSNQDTASVVRSTNDGRTLYVDALGSECTFETWITLQGNAAVVRNRLTSFRSDTTAPAPSWPELPALYTAGPYRLVTYDGNAPFTRGPVDDISALARGAFFVPDAYGVFATEHWAALLDDHNLGVGLVEPDVTQFAGLSGSPFGSPSGYLTGTHAEVLDSNIVYDYTYTLVVGSLAGIRAYAYAHRPDLRPSYVFRSTRAHFTFADAADAGFPISGALRVRPTGDHPQLIGPGQVWPARRVPRLYVRGAWHTQQTTARVIWSTGARPFSVIANGQFHTYRVDLFRSPGYTGAIDGIRLEPVETAEPAGRIDVTCISWHPCPIDRAAERALAASADVPLLDRFDSLRTAFWSVTGNSIQATAAVRGGGLDVSVTADAVPLPGQDGIGAGLYSRCTLDGDLDTQVDYRLVDWPAGNAVHVSFSTDNQTLYRHNEPNGELVSSYFPPATAGANLADDRPAGTLRFTRVGTYLAGYYRSSTGSWIKLDGVRKAGPLNVGISLWTNRTPDHAKNVEVVFDNFRVTRGTVSCP